MAERVSTNRATHQIVVFGLSDRGLQRENNEDHFMVADLSRKVIGVHDNQLRAGVAPPRYWAARHCADRGRWSWGP